MIEKQAFYDLADEMGLMVWQEFPLSCSNYPQDAEFTGGNVSARFRRQYRRAVGPP